MGKTRKPKIRHALTANPLGMMHDSGDDDEYMNGGGTSVGPVEAIREQLLNANVEEKLNALQSLAVLVVSGHKEKLAALCQSDIIRIAAPYLCERDQPLRNAAAGALRNFSVCVTDACDYLVEQDVLTPLLTLLNEYLADAQWVPSFDESMGGQLDLRSDTFLQAINLLWNLCESSAAAVDTFNQAQLLERLIRCLDFKMFGLEIAISVAQCLLVVSESNPKAWHIFSQYVNTFLQLLDVNGSLPHTYLRTLAAGILSNVPALGAAYTNSVLHCLNQTLNVDQQAALVDALKVRSDNDRNDCVNVLDVNMDTADEETEEAASLRRRKQELPTVTEIAFKETGQLLDAQRIAAEVITNMLSTEEDEWIDTDDDGSDGEGVVDYETERSASSTNLNDEDKLSPELIEIIKSLGLVQQLWQKAQPLSDETSQQLRERNISLLIKVKNLRISALLCLQNLCNSLSADDMGGAEAIYNVWVELGQQVFKGPQDVALLEPATSLMRAALERLKSYKTLFTQMTNSDLELIFNGVKNCSVAEIRANWLRMLGTLGCLLPEALVKTIIMFIIEACVVEEDVWTISEAIDALMDMFADNDWNQLIVELQLPEVLKKQEKMFKNKIRQQKRELKERYPAVQTVRTNLTRFIKYLETEASKCTNGKANMGH